MDFYNTSPKKCSKTPLCKVHGALTQTCEQTANYQQYIRTVASAGKRGIKKINKRLCSTIRFKLAMPHKQ